jgi:hypothetical protein
LIIVGGLCRHSELRPLGVVVFSISFSQPAELTDAFTRPLPPVAVKGGLAMESLWRWSMA